MVKKKKNNLFFSQNLKTKKKTLIASYSDGYSYSNGNSKQFFLATVLGKIFIFPKFTTFSFIPNKQNKTNKTVGNTDARTSDKNIRNPKPGCHSVTGEANGCQVYMVYESFRAYPSFLITYK